MDKLIADIRYFASEYTNEDSSPSGCSFLFNYPKSLNYWGARIAVLLRGSGFSLGTYDHLYINFTSAISEGSILPSEKSFEKWLRYVNFGVSFHHLNSLSEPELETFLIRSTFEVLFKLFENNQNSQTIIKSAEEEINKHGSDIELPVKTKETKSYAVKVTYKLRPKGSSSYGIVNYINHKSGLSFSKRFVDLKGPSDIFPLVGSISIKEGIIIIKPRSSFRADIYTKSYDVPFEIDIENESCA